MASIRSTQVTYEAKRRRQWFEAAMCFGLPIIFMVLRAWIFFLNFQHTQTPHRLHCPRTSLRHHRGIRLPSGYILLRSRHFDSLDSTYPIVHRRYCVCWSRFETFYTSPSFICGPSLFLEFGTYPISLPSTYDDVCSSNGMVNHRHMLCILLYRRNSRTSTMDYLG